MNELIPLHQQPINSEMVQTVSARELHAFLDVKTKYYDWITKRIQDYGFRENDDYVCLTEKKVTQTSDGREGSANILTHYTTLDMAKELAMVERNEKGKQARKYFIECEKQLLSQRSLPRTYAEALRAYADEVEARELAEQQLAIAEPKAEYFDELVSRNLLTNFRDTAKEFGWKQKAFIEYLLSNQYIYRDQRGKLRPYAQHTPSLFEVKEFTKGGFSDVQTLITPKGRETLRLLLT